MDGVIDAEALLPGTVIERGVASIIGVDVELGDFGFSYFGHRLSNGWQMSKRSPLRVILIDNLVEVCVGLRLLVYIGSQLLKQRMSLRIRLFPSL